MWPGIGGHEAAVVQGAPQLLAPAAGARVNDGRDVWPDGRDRIRWPTLSYWCVSPRWARCSTSRQAPSSGPSTGTCLNRRPALSRSRAQERTSTSGIYSRKACRGHPAWASGVNECRTMNTEMFAGRYRCPRNSSPGNGRMSVNPFPSIRLPSDMVRSSMRRPRQRSSPSTPRGWSPVGVRAHFRFLAGPRAKWSANRSHAFFPQSMVEINC